MFHNMMTHARLEVTLAKLHRSAGDERLATDYLAQALARRRAARGYRRGGGR